MKASKKTTNSNNHLNHVLKDILCIMPVIFTLAVIPLIVRLKVIDYTVGGKKDFYDFFAYWKAALLYVVALASIVPVVWFFKKGKLKSNRNVMIFTLFSVAYLFACVASAVFSKNVQISILGFPCQQEGLFTILSVFIISMYAAFFVDTQRKREMAVRALYISSIIIFIIGILQMAGLNPLNTELFKNMIVPGKLKGLVNGIVFPDNSSFSFRNTIYSTLYNSNVFGTYAAVILAVSFSDAVYKDSWKGRLLPLTITFLSLFTLIGCYSRGAYLGAAFAVTTVLLLSFRRIKANVKEVLVCVLCLCISASLAVFVAGGRVFNRLATVDTSYQDTVTGVQERMNNYSVKDNLLTLYFNKNQLKIEKKDNNLVFMDKEGKVLTLDYSQKDEGYTINSNGFKDFMVSANKDMLYIKKQNSLIYFLMKNNTFLLSDIYGNPVEIKKAETALFEGKERFASGRGYIWSRTLPLLKKTILLGYGPDNFYYVFPQDDYMGKLNFMYDAYMPVDMAHSMYLQSAVETGMVSIVILILLLLWIFLTRVRGALSREAENSKISTNVASAAVIAAYTVCGIFTDANVCTMIIFWPLIGSLINHRLVSK